MVDELPAGPFSPTATGHRVFILEPDPAAITLRAIGAGLAKQCRWNGACRSFYSVAQHSVLVADQLPMTSPVAEPPALLKIFGLFHDAHEIITGDICSPMKQAIRSIGGDGTLARIEAGLDRAIRQAFGIWVEPPPEWLAQIKQADRVALATEARDLVQGDIWSTDLPPPAETVIEPLAWDRAQELFLDRARELAAIAGLEGGAWDR